MKNFWEIWENIRSVNKLDLGSEDVPVSKAVMVYEKAMNPANKNKDFWTVFLDLCNPAEGMAELLGIDDTAVRNFGPKIESARMESSKRQNQPQNVQRSQVVQTGQGPKAASAESPENMETPETRPIGT